MSDPFSVFSDEDRKDWRRQAIIKDQMREAGFSTRTINALYLHLKINDLSELRTLPWEDQGETRETRGLRWQVSISPGAGAQVMAEVEAYRAGLDPRQARAPGPTRISAAFSDEELAALDAWREAQGAAVNRGEAVKALAMLALEARK